MKSKFTLTINLIICAVFLYSSRISESTYHNSFILAEKSNELIIGQNNKKFKIDTLAVFGDSLSDNHNTYTKTFGVVPSSSFYWNGRFSNGPMWVDYLSDSANWKLLNYASGGSRLSVSDFARPTGLVQVQDFIDDHKDLNRKTTMAAIWFGGNDYLSLISKNSIIQDEKEIKRVEDKIKKVKADYQTAIKMLKDAGFENILLLTLPRLNTEAMALEEGRLIFSRDYAVYHHNIMLKNLAKDEDLLFSDTYKINEDSSNSLEKYAFSSLERCYKGNLTGINTDKTVCLKPLFSKYYDDLHPSTRMHCYYAAKILYDLKINKDEELIQRCTKL